MKVFVPISDALLSERGELSGVLVPFTPDLLIDKVKGQTKGRPDHWISTPEFRSAEKSASQNLKFS